MLNMRIILFTAAVWFFCIVEGSSVTGSCSVHCQATAKKKPVCASDRQSYPSKCEVRRQRICFGKKNLEWVHEGECLEANRRGNNPQEPVSVYGLPKQVEASVDSNKNCTTKKLEAEQDSQKLVGKRPGSLAGNASSSGIMIPRCKADGSYEEVQCHPSTGYCWCVQPDTGTPIRLTSMQYTRPQCGSDSGDISSECDESEKALFNSNLWSTFKSEYDTISEDDKKKFTTGYESIQGMTEENSKIAVWRFNSLDKNGDMQLTSHELKDLKRNVRKNIKPKGCAKVFLTYCDRNSDALITFQEWNFCLGGNTHLSFHLFLSLNAVGPHDQLKWNGNVLPSHDESQSSESKDSSPELMEHQKKLWDMLSGESGGKDKDDGSNKLRNADQYGGNDRIDRSPNDRSIDNVKLVSLATKTCMDEREEALAKRNDQTFVPSCRQGGGYEPTQCHSFSGYCWCVNPEEGWPIPGTSKLKEDPACDSVTVRRPDDNIITAKPRGKKKGKNSKKRREIPGCPSPHHGAFLTQLVDLLTREMASAGGNLPAQLTNSANMSLEEKAIRWKAITADKNDDKKLSKKEMRFVRHMVKEKQIKAPEKCAKKFIKFCDTDRDDYVDVEELLVCTEVRRKNRRNQRKQDNIRHKGNKNGNSRNPFTNLLKPS